MVLQTRRIVEDFVLYKIHSMLMVEEEQTLQRALHLTEAFEPSGNELLMAMRGVGDEYERKYKQTFPDLMEQLRSANISSEDISRMFRKISSELFQISAKKTVSESQKGVGSNNHSHIKWGHVVGLLVFAGLLAVRAVELKCPEQVDRIIIWVTDFFNVELSDWLEAHGGWVGIQKFKQPENLLESSKSSSLLESSRLVSGRASLKSDRAQLEMILQGPKQEDLINYSEELQRGGISVEQEHNQVTRTTGIQSVMGVGVLAACVGLGAIFLSKK